MWTPAGAKACALMFSSSSQGSARERDERLPSQKPRRRLPSHQAGAVLMVGGDITCVRVVRDRSLATSTSEEELRDDRSRVSGAARLDQIWSKAKMRRKDIALEHAHAPS